MADRDLSMGPREGVTYPLKVQYCGNCSMPIEYCEYYPEYDKCKQWLEKNLPTEFEKVKIGELSRFIIKVRLCLLSSSLTENFNHLIILYQYLL